MFTRSGGVWTFQAQLTASDGAAGDFFGNGMALSGDTALLGAVLDDVGANANQGSAYVFTRTGGVWTQQAKLTASNGAAGDEFGHAVALSEDTALMGARVGGNVNQGAAYVFTRTGGVWTEQAQLTASDGAAGDSFGAEVALNGDTALVGAHGNTVGANVQQGSAYVFTRMGGVWTEQAQLTASDGGATDFFSAEVALSGDTALVGAVLDDVGANVNQGSAYVFTRTGGVWTQEAHLTASDGAAGDLFGRSVALSGDTALIGADGDDVGPNADQGSMYVFTRTGAVWTQQAQLTASDGAAGDAFGFRAALSGDTALVGAHRDDIGANVNQGSAYVFVGFGPAPATLTLAPTAATNVVGSEHCVTATVKDAAGNPVPDITVRFTVIGSVTTSGSATTNATGEATFCYTGPAQPGADAITAYADTDNDNTEDVGEPSSAAAKTWVAGPPAILTLSPPTATSAVGSEHCVTATVTDAFGNPVAGVVVRFTVTGAVETTGSATTNASGEAIFCYTGPALPGADAITAYADRDEDNVQDPDEPSGAATKTWVLPPSTAGCRVTGGGQIRAANGDPATFGGNAQLSNNGETHGQLEYQDLGPAQPLKVKSINVQAVVCDGATQARIFGQATINGAGSFSYRITMKDLSEPGSGKDMYSIVLSNGYASGEQALEGGNIQIHK